MKVKYMKVVMLMLKREGGIWTLPKYNVHYKEYGETHEQVTHDKQWWLNLEQKWEHIEIIEIKNIAYSEKQVERLQEVQELTEEGFEYYAYRYAVDGLFPDELEEGLKYHPYKMLQLEKKTKNSVSWLQI